MPFTYLIGWSALDKWYIGARWADGCAPSDLWSTYFTSSKYVAALRERHGEPDIIEIDQVFENKKAALQREIFLLQINRAKERGCFLNKAVGGIFDPSDLEIRSRSALAHRGKKQSPETIEKRIAPLRGRVRPEAHGRKISAALAGKKLSPSHCESIAKAKKGNANRKGTSTSDQGRKNIGAAKIGCLHSAETKQKMAEAHKGRKFRQVECPHCGKVGGESAMKQWHFSHCKFLKEK